MWRLNAIIGSLAYTKCSKNVFPHYLLTGDKYPTILNDEWSSSSEWFTSAFEHVVQERTQHKAETDKPGGGMIYHLQISQVTCGLNGWQTWCHYLLSYVKGFVKNQHYYKHSKIDQEKFPTKTYCFKENKIKENYK